MNIVSPTNDSVRAGSNALNFDVEADWLTEMRTAIRDPAELAHLLGLPADIAASAVFASKDFPLFIPRPYLAKISPGNIEDPLLRQVLPLGDELESVAGFSTDPLGEEAATLSPGLLKKYVGRALLVTTGVCAVHCRYCFRRHFPYEQASRANWTEAIQQLTADESIEELLLSGGDPLTLSDGLLAELAEQLSAIPHLKRVRIHSRLPVMIPSRINDEFLKWFTGGNWQPIFVLHANHAQELDAAAAAALKKMQAAGVMLLNQSVLLRGVNDNVDTLSELSLRLIECGVTPYYLHQMDRVQGAAHFEVSLDRGMQLVAEMRRRLPGYAIPRYVQERAGEASKTVLS